MRGNASPKSVTCCLCLCDRLGHLLWSSGNCDDKGSENTAIPDLLEHLSVKGCLISIDAMGIQKVIANKIIKK